MTWHPPEELKYSREQKTNGGNKKRTQPEESPDRTIMHIDMDAFFAAIEQRDNPQLRGKPVIIGGLPGGRGVVSTCSYEARDYGIKSGMSLIEAERRCPKGIYLKTNGKKYTYTAVKIIDIFLGFTPIVEPVSIDEAFLDITSIVKIKGDEKKLALRLKKAIYDQLKLTCTVGIAHTRIFAKLASGLKKPDGLTIFYKKEMKSKIYPLPVEKLWGIGEKTTEVLHEIGIFSIGDLAQSPTNLIKNRFGVNGERLIKTAQGRSSSSVIPVQDRENEKSIGHEHTFHADKKSFDAIFKMLLKLSQKVGRRMRKRGFAGKTLTLKLRYDDFETHTHRRTLPNIIWDDREIYEECKLLFMNIYEQDRSVRLVGISMSKLVPVAFTSNPTSYQFDLFDEPYKKNEILPVMDSLRSKYGEKIISRCRAAV